MRGRPALCLAALLVLAAGCAKPAFEFEPDDRIIADTTLIDVAAGTRHPGTTIVVRGDRIAALLDAATTVLPGDAKVLATGGYVIPGLWDMHVHALSNPDEAIRRALPLFIANGVTGIRDMGSVVDGLVDVRRRLAGDPSLAAPEIVASGPLLDGARLPWYGDLPLVLESPAEVDEALAKLEASGVDFFKVYDQLSPEVYDAIAAYANEKGIAFAGHPPTAIGMTRAAEAGQRTIEHLSVFTLADCVADPDAWFQRALDAKFGQAGYDAYYDVVIDFFMKTDGERCERAFEAIKAAGTYFTPTLVMELNDRDRVDRDSLAYLGRNARLFCAATLEAVALADANSRRIAYGDLLSAANTLYKLGIPLLAGSDTPNYCLVPGFSLHTELERLVEAGVSRRDALAAATINAAAALGKSDEFGVVAEGYRASLVVLLEDPLDDIRNTRTIRGVMVSGRWYGGGVIRGMLQSARPAAE